VNAQLPPLLPPAMAHPPAVSVIAYAARTAGMISSRRNVAYASSKASYSAFRFWLGSTKTATVTGVSPLWIRLSRTTGARTSNPRSMYQAASWKTRSAAGRSSAYCAGTYTQ